MYVFVNVVFSQFILLYIQLDQVDGRVLVSKVLITAHSDLYIVSGRVRELPTEPGRGVELAA